MQKLLSWFISLIYDNSCLICNLACKDVPVCLNCKNSFTQRNQNYIKEFHSLTVYSWGYYDGSLREGILKLKNREKSLAKYFSGILIQFWGKIKVECNFTNPLVIPVPSHKRRIRERGYCHSSLMAKHLANHFSYDFNNQLITRIKYTHFMNKLPNVNSRHENIRNAFKVDEEIKKYSNILIVDDILTSGTTLCELTKEIRKIHANANIKGLTVASGDVYN